MSARWFLMAVIAATYFPAALAEPIAYKSAKGTGTILVPRWEHDGSNLSPDQINALVTELNGVELSFDLSRHLGKRVQLFLTLPLSVKGMRGSDGLRVEWRTRGRLLAGSVSPGGRALVYQGVVKSRELGDVFDFTLRIDGRLFLGGLGFDPGFDIEVLPQ